jgi:hypothetical protein
MSVILTVLALTLTAPAAAPAHAAGAVHSSGIVKQIPRKFSS